MGASARLHRGKPQVRVASGSEDGSVRIWDVQTGEVLHKLCGHSGAVHALTLRYQAGSGSGSPVSGLGQGAVEFVVSGSSDGSVRLWNVFTEKYEAELAGHGRPVLSLAVLANGAIVSGAADGSVRVWGPSQKHGPVDREKVVWSCEMEMVAHSQQVRSLSALSLSSVSSAAFISGGADGQIKLWELPIGAGRR